MQMSGAETSLPNMALLVDFCSTIGFDGQLWFSVKLS